MRACDDAKIREPYSRDLLGPRKWAANRTDPTGSFDRDVRFLSAKVSRDGKDAYVLDVGHTDNQGAMDANVALSQRRAEAVVAALVSDYKVDAGRLRSRGVASFAPVATNRSDAGRAKNRRVELVEQ